MANQLLKPFKKCRSVREHPDVLVAKRGGFDNNRCDRAVLVAEVLI
ncbi:MAG: hypothetical protein VKL59_25155 [Nostocaceae cyanobacterium]|nr:hypothetical protein [Nostocaceae cyanobacterium]